MTNSERLLEVLRTTTDGMQDLLSSTLSFESYESLTKKKWNEATSALRSMEEAVSLLETVLNIDSNKDIDSLPEFSNEAINSYGASFGNRCYFQRNHIKRWLNDNDEDSDNRTDYRFDLDLDLEIHTEHPQINTKHKVSIQSLIAH